MLFYVIKRKKEKRKREGEQRISSLRLARVEKSRQLSSIADAGNVGGIR